jgi:hypothetical protein
VTVVLFLGINLISLLHRLLCHLINAMGLGALVKNHEQIGIVDVYGQAERFLERFVSAKCEWKEEKKKLIDCRESRFSLSSGKKKPSVG